MDILCPVFLKKMGNGKSALLKVAVPIGREVATINGKNNRTA
jgi:hypothetical protein